MEATEWQIEERMPRFDDMRSFDVWLRNGEVRRVRRVGNRSTYFTPGTLIFLDCTHPLQNAICDDDMVAGWRYSGVFAPASQDVISPPWSFDITSKWVRELFCIATT